jgi:CheY-like chemotaxis protein
MKPTILVMDDEKIIRLFLEKTLGKKYELVIKENGFEGLNWLKEGNNPDVIISDLHMPYLNGYELLNEIQSDVVLRNIPVIMLSGMESYLEKEKCYSLGASVYLSKPLNISHLVENIEKLIACLFIPALNKKRLSQIPLFDLVLETASLALLARII